MSRIDDINIESHNLLVSPESLCKEYPVTSKAQKVINASHRTIRDIITGADPRLMVIVGPCSIHDVSAALEYAKKLKSLSEKVSSSLYLVMRVYFEKPRTTVGWKGLINDPYLDDSFNIDQGLRIGRQLLIDIAEIGLPIATEALDPITPQYFQELISWSAIGARTTESQTHREMASGLGSAIGIKNATNGSLDVAINALKVVSHPHRFLGVNKQGCVSVVTTRGNDYGHIVLRGGSGEPNYDPESVAQCERSLREASLPENIMIDCSHANSAKDHNLQPLVFDNVVQQILDGNTSILGAMLESNLHAGNQKIPADLTQLQYGVSVTDACMDWQTTEDCLLKAATSLHDVLNKRRVA